MDTPISSAIPTGYQLTINFHYHIMTMHFFFFFFANQPNELSRTSSGENRGLVQTESRGDQLALTATSLTMRKIIVHAYTNVRKNMHACYRYINIPHFAMKNLYYGFPWALTNPRSFNTPTQIFTQADELKYWKKSYLIYNFTSLSKSETRTCVCITTCSHNNRFLSDGECSQCT